MATQVTIRMIVVVWRLMVSIPFCRNPVSNAGICRKCNESLKPGVQRGGSLPGTCLTTFKLDPSGVEAVQHPYAWHRVFHPLRLEQGFPSLTRDGLHLYRTTEDRSECAGDVVGR